MYNMENMFINICKLFIVLSLYVTCVYTFDQYIEESENICHKESGFLTCGKYKMLKYLSHLVEPMDNTNINTIRLVKLTTNNNNRSNDESLFSSSRHLTEDTEFSKLKKFLLRKINNFTNNQGLIVKLPEDIKIIQDGNEIVEGRGKKKKVELLLSILTLFKVFKVKVLVGLVLVSIIFIKKTLLLGALYLPSVLHSIKASCKEAGHSISYIHDDHDAHDNFGSEYDGHHYHH